MSLSGHTAIVTGGARGIGLAVARALLALGANVVVTATRDDTVASVVGRLEREGGLGRVLGHRADVRVYAEMEAVMSAAAERFGRIHILVNNAGVGGFTPVADTSPDEWSRIIDTNLTGVFHGCRAALTYLRQQGGWIINISSLASKHPFPNGAAYCASKAALNAFSESLMQEVRYDGIRVACVLPGSVNTGFGGPADTKSGWALEPEDVAEAVTDLLAHPARSLPSRIEIRPAQPPRKS
jgi:NAD(P)-dependent dehydrogenase (short-subunit alcohol dehydrogenase family)